MNKTKWYIDDLISINGKGAIRNYLSEIYPPGLQPGKENVDDDKATFLELNIKISEDKFLTSVYDKRDDFPFSIVQYPSVKSNIPEKILYNVFVSQIVCYIRVCNTLPPLQNRIALLAEKLKKKGAKISLLHVNLKKVIIKYSKEVYDKFGLVSAEFLGLVQI